MTPLRITSPDLSSGPLRAEFDLLSTGNYGGDAAWEEVKPKKTKPVVKDEVGAHFVCVFGVSHFSRTGSRPPSPRTRGAR